MALAFAVATACYHPTLRDCAVECSAPTDCSGDQICRDGWCTGEGTDACQVPSTSADSGAGDAAVDGPLPDSDPGLCPLGCTNGTCDANGVCVIDCSATGSCAEADVRCPPNVPCRVICGDGACAKKIICGLATSCDVDCVGTGSCRDEIQCGTIPCDVTCSGASSCAKRVKCGMSCSCDVRCTGINACAEIAECPMGTSCALGRGCSSVVPGCETCAP
ncbi:MAG: hypothetical protein H0T42_12935 [Deltaproteobacteria bacterium]|nr:hypothetical protein [Deltaproteobacteria bacterium]